MFIMTALVLVLMFMMFMTSDVGVGVIDGVVD